MSWDPGQYLMFEGHRLRPALELLAGIPPDVRPAAVVDLGCGAGNVAKILAQRWPGVRLFAVDNDEAMLAATRKNCPTAMTVQGDIGTWRLEKPVDVIYSNAAIHWAHDQRAVFTNLLDSLKPGGWLAVQMPRNHEANSHQAIYDLIAQAPWRDKLAGVKGAFQVPEPGFYADLLQPHCDPMRIWETTYYQFLSGENPVLNWVMGTTLRPYLTVLSEEDQATFLGQLGQRLARAYPPRADGSVLFPFKRIFMIARRV